MKNPFDIKEYLTSQDIHFKEEGENIGHGSIGICCPSCGDDNYHLGIDVDSKIYNCWKCEEQGNLIGLIMLLEDCSSNSAILRIKENQTEKVIERANFQDKVKDILSGKKTVNDVAENRVLKVPCTHYLNELNPEFVMDRRFLSFIEERNYTVDELMDWGVRAELLEEFGFRLMFPVAFKGQVVSYLGRTVIGEDPKYKNCSNANAIIPMRQLLYGYDSVKVGQDKLVICEGVFDVIRFGKGVAVGIFGKDISVDQIALICSLEIKKEIWIALDGEAFNEANKIIKNLKPLVTADVKLLILESGKDPDNYDREELLEMIN